PDSFSARASDVTAPSTVAAVSLLALHDALPILAVVDSYLTAEDTPLTVAAPGVLGNDVDPDVDPLTAVLVAGPAHGTLSLNPDGSFTYTPATNYHSLDSFSYQATDGTAASNVVT